MMIGFDPDSGRTLVATIRAIMLVANDLRHRKKTALMRFR